MQRGPREPREPRGPNQLIFVSSERKRLQGLLAPNSLPATALKSDPEKNALRVGTPTIGSLCHHGTCSDSGIRHPRRERMAGEHLPTNGCRITLREFAEPFKGNPCQSRAFAHQTRTESEPYARPPRKITSLRPFMSGSPVTTLAPVCLAVARIRLSARPIFSLLLIFAPSIAMSLSTGTT